MRRDDAMLPRRAVADAMISYRQGLRPMIYRAPFMAGAANKVRLFPSRIIIYLPVRIRRRWQRRASCYR